MRLFPIRFGSVRFVFLVSFESITIVLPSGGDRTIQASGIVTHNDGIGLTASNLTF
jgi:hypothetical protein